MWAASIFKCSFWDGRMNHFVCIFGMIKSLPAIARWWNTASVDGVWTVLHFENINILTNNGMRSILCQSAQCDQNEQKTTIQDKDFTSLYKTDKWLSTKTEAYVCNVSLPEVLCPSRQPSYILVGKNKQTQQPLIRLGSKCWTLDFQHCFSDTYRDYEGCRTINNGNVWLKPGFW